jgi:hypothetical protein
VDQIEQPDADAIAIRYAETDDDVIAIHQFLLIVAQPQMRAGDGSSPRGFGRHHQRSVLTCEPRPTPIRRGATEIVEAQILLRRHPKGSPPSQL